MTADPPRSDGPGVLFELLGLVVERLLSIGLYTLLLTALAAAVVLGLLAALARGALRLTRGRRPRAERVRGLAGFTWRDDLE
ncbi:hypothetical protein ACFVIM_05430 [Streptomyces sp. NPDC057638]|uniref:hypothetical protein n=1 Tax=Streptomyces sp. NPDC057638 TaxID=3346190 RepID=UPI0036800D6F